MSSEISQVYSRAAVAGGLDLSLGQFFFGVENEKMVSLKWHFAGTDFRADVYHWLFVSGGELAHPLQATQEVVFLCRAGKE